MEMLVVVALVSIVATIGVNTYESFVIRTRESEAQVGLGQIYMAEKNFSVTEFSFTACLDNIGISETNPSNYWKGFDTSGSPPGTNCGPGGTQSCAMYSYNAGVLCDPTTVVVTNGVSHTASYWVATQSANGAAFVDYPWVVSQNAFLAGAQGGISAKNPNNDTWTIDQTKTLLHPIIGE
jgi:type II secretory pathway pseudopilin PulG